MSKHQPYDFYDYANSDLNISTYDLKNQILECVKQILPNKTSDHNFNEFVEI